MRLDHYLALASVGTKNKVREYIYDGLVTVNGTICLIPSQAINTEADIVTYLNEHLSIKPVYYVLNKPQNCMTAREASSFTVFDCISEVDTPGIFAVGRLDKDTEGLIFLTNDGHLSNQLMAPDQHITKTYYFLSLGTLTSVDIQQLENGMDIGESITTKPASVRVLKTGLYHHLAQEIGLSKMKRIKRQPEDQVAFIGEIIISEGKKHQVKRMLRGVNCPIIYLKRIAIGSYYLPDSLASGNYIPIAKEALLQL